MAKIQNISRLNSFVYAADVGGSPTGYDSLNIIGLLPSLEMNAIW